MVISRGLSKEEQLEDDKRIAKGALHHNLDLAAREILFLITVTPTGKARNVMTDVNIHITAALSALKEF